MQHTPREARRSGTHAASETADPLIVAPIPVPRVWGGRRLVEEIHPELRAGAPPGPIGETWELSDVGGDPARHSRIAAGPFRGCRLRELLEASPAEFLGASGGADRQPARLPLLFKLLDARDDLSVQIHPDDDHVAHLGLEGAGKTEAWVILDTDSEATIICGLAAGVSYADYLALARAGRGDQGLQRIPVARGDVVYLPAGTVHALGAGVLLAEIQQSSDTTYRLHDWNRVGLDGRPRELHLDLAARLTPTPSPHAGAVPVSAVPASGTTDPGSPPSHLRPDSTARVFRRRIDRSRQGAPFTLWELPPVPGGSPPPTGGAPRLPRAADRFGILAVLDGELRVPGEREVLSLGRGAVAFVPATCALSEVEPTAACWALWMEPA